MDMVEFSALVFPAPSPSNTAAISQWIDGRNPARFILLIMPNGVYRAYDSVAAMPSKFQLMKALGIVPVGNDWHIYPLPRKFQAFQNFLDGNIDPDAYLKIMSDSSHILDNSNPDVRVMESEG